LIHNFNNRVFWKIILSNLKISNKTLKAKFMRQVILDFLADYCYFVIYGNIIAKFYDQIDK